jgi:hypothetical protein
MVFVNERYAPTYILLFWLSISFDSIAVYAIYVRIYTFS